MPPCAIARTGAAKRADGVPWRRPSAATPCDTAEMQVGAQFKVPAAQRLRRLLAAGLRGRATGGGAVFLVTLLAIDSPAGDRGRSLSHVNQKPYSCVPAPGRRSPLSQVPFGKENIP